MGSVGRKSGRARRAAATVCVTLGLAGAGSAGARESEADASALRDAAGALINAVRARVADCAGRPTLVASAAVVSDAQPDGAARPALRWNPQLGQAAARHAGAMARTRLFDHVGADGTTVRDRVDATGYRWRLVGENLAAGHALLEDAVAGWLESPAHCAALLDPRYTEFAIARSEAERPDDPYGVYWTLVLGRPR
jgi:uncharacterized protein YkwD